MNERVKQVTTKGGSTLKIAMPARHNMNPISSEQWDEISQTRLMMDSQGDLMHAQVQDLTALESFIPKDARQEAMQVFHIASFSKTHPLSVFMSAAAALDDAHQTQGSSGTDAKPGTGAMGTASGALQTNATTDFSNNPEHHHGSSMSLTLKKHLKAPPTDPHRL